MTARMRYTLAAFFVAVSLVGVTLASGCTGTEPSDGNRPHVYPRPGNTATAQAATPVNTEHVKTLCDYVSVKTIAELSHSDVQVNIRVYAEKSGIPADLANYAKDFSHNPTEEGKAGFIWQCAGAGWIHT